MKFNQRAQDYAASTLHGWYLNLSLSDTVAYIFFAVAFVLQASGRSVEAYLTKILEPTCLWQ